MNRTNTRTSQHGVRRLEYHGHVNDHTVAFTNTLPLQNVSEIIDLFIQVIVSQAALRIVGVELNMIAQITQCAFHGWKSLHQILVDLS